MSLFLLLFFFFVLSFVVCYVFAFAEPFMMDAQSSTSSRRHDKSIAKKKHELRSFSQTEKEMINTYKYVYTEKKTESPTKTPKKKRMWKIFRQFLKTAEILNISSIKQSFNLHSAEGAQRE